MMGAMQPEPPLGDRSYVIWVLDDPRTGTAAQAIGIAERLGLPFRRIPLAWNCLLYTSDAADE